MKKFLSFASVTLLLVGAVCFVATAEEDPIEMHVSQIDPAIIEAARVIDCQCNHGGGGLPWEGHENMQADKYGYLLVNSNGYPICLPCDDGYEDDESGSGL